jgi:hypothetical protein
VNGDAVDCVLMRGIMLQELIHSDVPDLDCMVRRACCNAQAVGMEGHVVDRSVVCGAEFVSRQTNSQLWASSRHAKDPEGTGTGNASM